MQLHNLKRNTTNKKARQVGRGGSRGKTSGRGTKGQNARAGHKKRPEMRDIIKRIPKLRGRGKNFLKSRFADASVVKVKDLATIFAKGEIINRESLLAKRLIRLRNGKIPTIKILGSDTIDVAVKVVGVPVSAGAKKAIEAAGGSVEA